VTPNNTNSSREKRSDGLVISRRTFLGVSAGVAAAITVGYVIKGSKINFLSEPQESTEGVLTEKWVATSCLNCPTRCAIKVRVVNGKAVKIVGNTKSTYSDGKTCPRSHIGLQVLYDPDRKESQYPREGITYSRTEHQQ
jgi:anaerobic selenocysteine-containing dehydrogenase